ncbi:MAG: hypothetical protein ACJ79S_12545 [Gemmatimonadaceae bacterium]
MLTPAVGAWLLQLAATLPDTIVTKQVEQPRDWFNIVSGIASILISVSLLALCVGLIPAAWNFRKSYKKVNELLDKVYGDINPLMRHASTIADNLNYVTTSIRVDVQQVNQTIATANERLQAAVRQTERRVTDFNALLRVVQEEAEDAFVAAAATLRGVRGGAAAFSDDAVSLAELRRAASRRADLEARLQATVEEGDEELDYDELEHGLEEGDADLGDEIDEVLLAEELEEQELAAEARERAAARGPASGEAADAPHETGDTSDGHSGRVPPGGGGGERPRIRSRRRGAPGDAGRRDA